MSLVEFVFSNVPISEVTTSKVKVQVKYASRLIPEMEKLLALGVAIMEPQQEEAPLCLGEMVISEDKLSVNAKLVSQAPEVMKPC